MPERKPKLKRMRAPSVDEAPAPVTVTKTQAQLGIKILKAQVNPESTPDESKSVKEHWLHVQSDRKGDKALTDVDIYLADRIAKAKKAKELRDEEIKEEQKKSKKSGTTPTSSGTSGLSAMSIESELSVKEDPKPLPIAPTVRSTSSFLFWDWGLKDVAANDHLYLVSHGMLGGPKIGNWDNPRDQYTPEQIAARLEKHGLPKTHKTLKLFACWGASSVVPLDPSVIKKDDRPFAERLAAAMVARGYLQIQVHGFSGTVSTPSWSEKMGGGSSGYKKVDFSEKLSETEYPKYHGYALRQATNLGLTRVADSSDLDGLSSFVAEDYASVFGVVDNGDLQGVGKIQGWSYRGVYVTDTEDVPWVIVIPFPPEEIAHEYGIT
ncbi:MAG: hypothetical protein H6711_17940 [Myxococcales bacterium]|nr:hypothetical protein [Myxococcales bacterium]